MTRDEAERRAWEVRRDNDTHMDCTLVDLVADALQQFYREGRQAGIQECATLLVNDKVATRMIRAAFGIEEKHG